MGVLKQMFADRQLPTPSLPFCGFQRAPESGHSKAGKASIFSIVAWHLGRDHSEQVLRAVTPSSDRRKALRGDAGAYLTFARDHPALYEAMLTMTTGLHFADEETRPELRDAFAGAGSVCCTSEWR